MSIENIINFDFPKKNNSKILKIIQIYEEDKNWFYDLFGEYHINTPDKFKQLRNAFDKLLKEHKGE